MKFPSSYIKLPMNTNDNNQRERKKYYQKVQKKTLNMNGLKHENKAHKIMMFKIFTLEEYTCSIFCSNLRKDSSYYDVCSNIYIKHTKQSDVCEWGKNLSIKICALNLSKCFHLPHCFPSLMLYWLYLQINNTVALFDQQHQQHMDLGK